MKRTKFILKMVIAGVPAVLILLLVFLQSPPGKAALAAMLSRMLSSSEHLSVDVGRISGVVPMRVEIDDLAVGDSNGVWLEIEGLHCRFMIRDLLIRRLRVQTFSARSVAMHRIPTGRKTDRPARAKEAAAAWEVQLQNLVIERLHLDQAVAGVDLDYAVDSGGMRLSSSGALAGELEIRGDAEGRVLLETLRSDDGSRSLYLMAELDHMTHPDFGLDDLSGQAEATLGKHGVDANLGVAIRKGERTADFSSVLQFAGKQLTVESFSLATGGYTISGRAGADFSRDQVGLELDGRIVDAQTNTVAVSASAALSTGEGDWTVDVHRLKVQCLDVVGFSLSGRLEPLGVALNGRLEEFDLGRVPLSGFSNYTGQVLGSLQVNGTLADPALEAELDVVGFTSARQMFDELPELNFHVSAGIDAGQFYGSTMVTNEQAGSLQAQIVMPCAFAFYPFLLKPQFQQVEGRFLADLNFDVLNRLALFNDQRIAGRLESELTFANGFSGFARLEEGAYEHYGWGVVIRDIHAELEAAPGSLVVKTASASDGLEGRIAVSGGVQSGQMDLQLDMTRAAVIARDDMEGMISGELKLGGPRSRPELTGRLAVDRVDILLSNIPSPPPPLLSDYDKAVMVERPVEPKENRALPIGLDIDFDLSDQVFVHASMIDSVWGGMLRLQDAPGGVSVSGTLSPRRGYLSFVGKKFRLRDDGRVDLDGAIPPSASVDLAAEYTRSDIVAVLQLNGRLSDPVYSLTSTPPMPEEEVLSYVLFGRDVSSITPYQAYQIAAAARQLPSGMSGPGFAYQMRQALSVDTLEWREPDTPDGRSSVAAGKYLTPGLYVEVHSSFEEQEGSTGMTAEYEVTRLLSIETSTGPQMRPGIGVNWKNDY
jgi:autotransporter translocation and assembly factor TamB